MLHTVKRVEHIEKYKLKLFFNNGKVKLVDFQDRLKEAKNMFLPLRDIDYFKKVKTDGTTLVWPNGLDLCPNVLYSIGKELTESKRTTQRHKPVHTAKRTKKTIKAQSPKQFVAGQTAT